MEFKINFRDYALKNRERFLKGSMEKIPGLSPNITSHINGERKKVYGEEFVVIDKKFEKNITRLLEITNSSYSLYESSYVKIKENESKDLLIAFNTTGMNCLGVLNKIFPNESIEIGLGFEVEINESKHISGGLYCPHYDKHTLIAILEIPKVEDVNNFNPEVWRQIYRDIKPIVSKIFIKNLKYENIKYLREYDRYVIVDFTDCRALITGIEFSFEKFICDETPYICNGRPISFEEYVFLEEVIS